MSMCTSQLLHPLRITPSSDPYDRRSCILKSLAKKAFYSVDRNAPLLRLFVGVRSSRQGRLLVKDNDLSLATHEGLLHEGGEFDGFPCIQTLRKFPKEELTDKVVMVRFDSTILLQENHGHMTQSSSYAHFTIQYLQEARARIILVSDWDHRTNSRLHALESVAEYLSSVLQVNVVPARCLSNSDSPTVEALEKMDVLLFENLSEFKGEVCNSLEFAKTLSSKVDIFVNDCFSQSHKVLASTVGITRFCCACVAGFHFEESLRKLKHASKSDKRPYIAFIGGANLVDKAAALHFLASICDGLVFVGMMSFQIMHALGLSIPSNLLEPGAVKEALDLVQVAQNRNITLLYPKDFWCLNEDLSKQFERFPAHTIPEGWFPADLGPRTLDEMKTLLTKSKKAIWIGPIKFKLPHRSANGTSELARMLSASSHSDCDVTVVGSMACKTMMNEASSTHAFSVIENASVLWDFLKGRKLPGVMALDRAFPFKIDWNSIFGEPTLPLVVDIGSGNGLFLLSMAKRQKDLNFLGLEINEKLVERCLLSVHQSGLKNGFFIATSATSTFRSIVSSYPGEIVLVSIQCPNPDFNKPENRWRMLQRSLIEAIADLLAPNGKVFCQSDIEAVAVRMKEQFIRHGKGKLSILLGQNTKKDEVWLEENPFGVRSDWEQHVLDRGDPMYRLMLSKLNSMRS